MARPRSSSSALARSSAPITVDPWAALAAASGCAPAGGTALPKDVIMLADVSASMGAAGLGGKSRLSLLSEALTTIRGGTILPYAAYVYDECEPGGIMDAIGSWGRGATMHGIALRAAAQRGATMVLLIADGEADDRRDAIAEAHGFRERGIKINALFVGNPADFDAIGHMKMLAEITGGTYQAYDMGRMPELGSGLDDVIGGLLSLPEYAGASSAGIAL